MHVRFRFLPLLLLAAACIAVHPARAQNHFGTVSALPAGQFVDAAFSPDSLHKFLMQLSGALPVDINGTPTIIPHRLSGTVPFLQAASFIAATFTRFGMNATIENNATPFNRTSVIGTLPGRRSEQVILCCHYDSRGTDVPGADDNGSGTAVVLEAARILSRYSFEYTLKFIAFGGEEQGLVGSQQYTFDHPKDSIRAVINTDMVLWDGDGDMTVQIHALANTTAQFSADLAAYMVAVDSVYNLPVECAKVIPGISASDHAPFWNAGRSAVLLIEEYGSDFNPYYHSSRDSWAVMNTPQNIALFHGAARLAILSGTHLALAPQTPVQIMAWNAAPRKTDFLDISPHPVSFTSVIRFRVSSLRHVTVRVLDVLGREVGRLVDVQLPAGTHSTVFERRSLPNGMYVLVMEAGRVQRMRPIVVVR